ncbi:CCA tRNA nucleotidyltransferase [Celeribacter neptunius]|uniref:Poly(A) polymerase n=1 Tax=Celeribacter neptunius TaxID=588602 RepID=A0A1I3SKP9_9RHOB|nr:CCA tRNA nucleotidyltransferase [Celeribacter neptunius]SFJ59295.1 poly(A) polymerase [Celeribacter neptunius]
MKLTAPWLDADHAQRLMAIFAEAGEQAYFVGGCVRNSLLGVPVSDLDVSSSARPEKTMELARAAGLKAVPTGIEHGTVTVVVEDEPFEITTFRHDVETDGRRAVVAFSEHVEDDAHRRDFTMNALYAAADGEIIDPLGGLADLEARRVRFIDDADQRIREDYLRILRFFRFHAWYGDDTAGLDPEGLAACAANLAGLETLSRERVGAEMVKLLSAPEPDLALGAMDQSGVLNALLPGASTKAFFLLTSMEQAPDPIVRLAALGAFDVADLLRLSKSQTRQYAALRRYAEEAQSIAEIAYRDGAKMAFDVAILRAAFFEQLLPGGLQDEIKDGEEALFPLKAKDLMPDFDGPALGSMLRQLEQDWIDSGFALDRSALLARAKEA